MSSTVSGTGSVLEFKKKKPPAKVQHYISVHEAFKNSPEKGGVFLAQRAHEKMPYHKGQSPLQELEVDPCSRPYPLVYTDI